MYCWPENVAHKEVVSYFDSFLSGLNGIKRPNLFPTHVVDKIKTPLLYNTLVRNGHFCHICHVFPIRGHSFLTRLCGKEA